jgi:hypothetical protein
MLAKSKLLAQTYGMNTIRPQVTYSPEGELTVVTGLNDGYRDEGDNEDTKQLIAAFRAEQLENLSSYSGVAVKEFHDDVVEIRIPVEQSLGHAFNIGGDPEIAGFLKLVNDILPYYPRDDFDRVVALEFLGSRGASGVINEHMQRWLNSGEISEEAARSCIEAMSLPIMPPKELQEFVDVKKDFRFSRYSSGVAADTGMIFGLRIKQDKFTVHKIDIDEDSVNEQIGDATWGNIDLNTLGNCACWGVSGENRSFMNIDRNVPQRLYQMDPHNVDTARQSLSLVLGIGSLAYYAALYQGDEDIYANVAWREDR